MLPFLFDPTFIIIIPAIVLVMYAQSNVKSIFNKYSHVYSNLGMTGAELAERILRRNGIYDVQVTTSNGYMTDHYDPRHKIVRLSSNIYSGRSITALGVAAHEVGHAIQHNEGYMPLSLRNSIVPLANIGSQMAFPLLFIGLILGFPSLAQIGVIVFMFAVLFQLLTLPVEFNASKRAVAILTNEGYVTGEEEKGIKKVLNAAALTYVAATAMAVLQLIRLLLISGLLGGRRD
jgi:Zn-dependent membrane protease YugP